MGLLSTVLGIFLLLVGLLVSIALHELGHLLPAKKFGCLVPRYMVGLGHTLFSVKRGDTEYGLKALPLGGYCKILGMYGPAAAATKIGKLDGRKLTADEIAQLSVSEQERVKYTLAQEARFASLEEVPQGQSSRAFYLLSVPKKLAVMFGGPLMNLLLAVLFMAVAFFGVGIVQPSTTVGGLVCEQQGKPALCTSQQIEQMGGKTDASSPALRAGLRPGDTIVAWAGHPVGSWEQLTDRIKHTDDAVQVRVKRAGETLNLQVKPENGAIGVVTQPRRAMASPAQYGQQLWAMASGTFKVVFTLPVAFYNSVQPLFTGGPRPQNSVMSIWGVSKVAGDIVAAPASSGLDLPGRIGTFLMLLASLNMALFVFNLIPLPPLDGGHITGALWQAIKGRIRRSSMPYGPRSPAYVDTAKAVNLTYAVAGVLVVISVLLIIVDIVAPVKSLF